MSGREISLAEFYGLMDEAGWHLMDVDDVVVSYIEVGAATMGDDASLRRLKDLLRDCGAPGFLYEHAMFVPENHGVVKVEVLKIIIRNIERDRACRSTP